VVELVVERGGFQWAFAIEHGQRAEATGFVDVTAIAVIGALGDEAFALPQELGGVAIDGFGDAAAEGVGRTKGGRFIFVVAWKVNLFFFLFFFELLKATSACPMYIIWLEIFL
jgi:hypothetical protein